MNKTSMLCGIAAIALATSAHAQEVELTQTEDPYFTGGQEALQQILDQQPNTNEARNIILFVADGMGVSTVTAARIYEGQQQGGTGEEHSLTFETLPYAGLIKTYNTDAQIPDSAGTSTAMHAGVKTSRGVVGVNSDVPRGDCAASKGNEVTSILELAEAAGMSTGVISTARITHATPAAGYSHSADRNWEDDKDLTAEAVENGCVDIATQLIEFPYGNGLEVAMGGGRRSFLPASMEDPEDAGQTGERQDDRNLADEWTQTFENSEYVWNAEQFEAVDPEQTDHLLGLFNRSHMQYEADRADDGGGEPSIAEMTGKAIEILSKNDEGYYLMIESGRVDHAHHGNNAYRALTDALAFDEAVETALDMVDLEETLVVVTADHSHVFTIAGYSDRGNPILGLSQQDGELNMGLDGKPYTTLGYANGPGGFTNMAQDIQEATATNVMSDATTTETENAKVGQRPDLGDVDVQDIDYLQQSTVPLESETHSGEDIAVYAVGPFAHLFQNTQEQSYIYHVMDHASKISQKAQGGN